MKNQQINTNKQILPLEGKVIGRTKHYPPAIREWKNAVYSYDNNYMRHIPVKYDITSKLIKSYFNINGLKKIARSKRMRSKVIRFSTRKLFVSNPEIKQSNDKATINIYVFNREKQFYMRKLFFYKRKSSMYNAWLLNRYTRKIKYSRGIVSQHSINLRNKRKALFSRAIKIKRHLPYNGMRFNNDIDFFRYKMKSFAKKFLYMDKSLTFSFISILLSALKITIIHPLHDDITDREQKRLYVNNIMKHRPSSLLWVSYDKTQSHFKLNVLKGEYINKTSLHRIISNDYFSIKNRNNLILKTLLNNYLWKLIENNFINNGIITKNNISRLYKIFMYNQYKILIKQILRKEAKLFFNYGKLYINKMKFTSLLAILKRLVSRIYNKSTELNIVNLKYLHLSSDIFAQAVTLKLRKKRNLFRVLKKSLKLVKIPFQYFFRRNGINFNTYLELNKYKALNLDKLPYKSNTDTHIKGDQGIKYIEGININSTGNDKLEEILNRIFPTKFSTMHSTIDPQVSPSNNYIDVKQKHSNKTINLLNNVKFKWISGLRLEVSGRLTRRNTASRSVSKLMYKGNLKNKQYYVEHGLLKAMPTVMLRNNININTQHALTNSKRRIGSFGIKSWMGSY